MTTWMPAVVMLVLFALNVPIAFAIALVLLGFVGRLSCFDRRCLWRLRARRLG